MIVASRRSHSDAALSRSRSGVMLRYHVTLWCEYLRSFCVVTLWCHNLVRCWCQALLPRSRVPLPVLPSPSGVTPWYLLWCLAQALGSGVSSDITQWCFSCVSRCGGAIFVVPRCGATPWSDPLISIPGLKRSCYHAVDTMECEQKRRSNCTSTKRWICCVLLILP